MTPDNCPLCGTSVALLRSPERRPATERVRERIVALRDRAAQLDRGDITPRTLKDEVLWMCGPCRRMMVSLPRLPEQELQRRIHEEVRGLERGGGRPETRAS